MKTQQNSKVVESSPAGTIIAAVCIVIYLAALVQASIRLYLSVEQHRIASDQEFANIANIALTAGTQGFMDERFIETMNNALAHSKTIEALIISGPEGEYAFERQKDRAITWINNSPRFINRFDFSGQAYQRPLPIQNLRNVNIQAVAGAFSYTEFSKILKETLFLILIGFALAFFTMLLQILLGKPEEITANAPVYTDRPESVSEPVMEKKSGKKEGGESGPKGLFSPRTNIGWEEYTKDRLDSELHRCASTEKDLTLIIFEFTDTMNDAMIKRAADEAVSFFTSRDLLFENGNKGITIIYPGIDLETSMVKAQKFHRRIMEKFLQSHKSNASLYIGLTSRSGRLLGAGRMMMEAMEALQRAKTDRESPIIAFKSDPDKYRKFIASQSPPMI